MKQLGIVRNFLLVKFGSLSREAPERGSNRIELDLLDLRVGTGLCCFLVNKIVRSEDSQRVFLGGHVR